MAAYTILTENSINTILENFNISPVDQFRILHGGSENTNYLVETSQGKFVITICENKTPEQANSLANLLVYFTKNNFRSSEIIKNKQGENFDFFQGKPVLLKTFLDGKVLESFSENLLEALGEQIAKLHEIPAPDYLPHSFSYASEYFHEVIDTNVSPDFSSWLANIQQYINESALPDLPRALIHSDIFCNNVIVMENDVPVIMDFEEACYFCRLFDLGMAVVGTCCENEKVIVPKVKSLLKGYEKILQLSQKEKENLPAMITYAAAATAFWRFKQFNIVKPEEALKNRFLEMKNIADHARSIEAKMYFD